MTKIIVALTGLLLFASATACAQVAIEYGTSAAKSAATTGGVGRAIDRANSRLATALENNTSSTTSAVRRDDKQHAQAAPTAGVSAQVDSVTPTRPVTVQGGVAEKRSSPRHSDPKYQSTVIVSFDK